MMTFKELVIDPLWEMSLRVVNFVPTLLTVVIILIIGLIFAKLFRDVVIRLFKEIRFDKIADKVGLTGVMHKGEMKYTIGELIGKLSYGIFIIIFVLIAVKTLGYAVVTDAVERLLAYVPHALSAVLVLALGMILAKFFSTVLHFMASLVDLPEPKMLERITRWAIVIYALSISIDELGYSSLFVGTPFHILLGGVALAIGLGLKDHVGKFFTK